MDKVNALATRHGLFVVEDAALSVGTKFKGVHAGLLGDVASFSFYPVKHITTAEGGMFTTRHAKIAAKVGRLKAFGYDKMVGERAVPGVYDVDLLGYNYRMNEIEAAIGVEQLKRVPDFLLQRSHNDAVLRGVFADITEIQCLADGSPDFQHAHYCLVAVVQDELADKRPEIINRLRDYGIGTSVYYPGPVPHLRYYREKYGLDSSSFPNATRISRQSIAFPVGPHLIEEDMMYIGRVLKDVLAAVKP
jgi:dTDP-4-amino-4,6-dideoxygalactose transaminase